MDPFHGPDGLPPLLPRHVAEAALRGHLARGACGVLVVEPYGVDAVAQAHGPDVADAVRATVVAHARERLGDGLLGRTEGDRLLAVVPAGPRGPEAALRDAARHLGGGLTVEPPTGDGPVRVRLVVAAVVGDEHHDLRDVLAAVAVALGRARERGGLVVADPQDAAQAARRRVRLMADLAVHLHRPELHMAYQPLVELARVATPGTADEHRWSPSSAVADGATLVGAEALLRWDHPVHGPIAPPEVLELAHDAGLTAELTLALAARVAADALEWRDATGRDPAICFNLSSRQLALVGPLEVLDLLALGVGTERTTVEVGDVGPEHAPALAAYRAAGARVAVDGVGPLLAAQHDVRGLPLDVVKLGRGFVSRLAARRDPDAVAALRVLLDQLGLDAVADGVETQAGLATAHGLGAVLGQGWLFGRPVDVRRLVGHAHGGTGGHGVA